MALPMTASTLESVVAAAGLVLPDDVLFVLDDNPELRGRGYTGHTWPDGARVTLYIDAFESQEELLRTVIHELVHVRGAGPPRDSVDLARREREAYAEEEQWWQSHRGQH